MAQEAVDAAEEAVKARMPANSDELLELRALNDAPTSAIASLTARAAALRRLLGAPGRGVPPGLRLLGLA